MLLAILLTLFTPGFEEEPEDWWIDETETALFESARPGIRTPNLLSLEPRRSTIELAGHTLQKR